MFDEIRSSINSYFDHAEKLLANDESISLIEFELTLNLFNSARLNALAAIDLMQNAMENE
jgi:hypothetical protein